jgi:ribonucleoside-diphosphate reductase alpha chain
MIEVQKRPQALSGPTEKIATGCGELYVTVNSKDEQPFEVFFHLGKQGGCSSAQLEALARTISIGLRSGVPIEEYYEHLKDIKCISPTFSDGENILSCADAIAKVFKKFVAKSVES